MKTIKWKNKKNFDENGFTDKGFVEYAKLRKQNIEKEKAIKALIKDDKK